MPKVQRKHKRNSNVENYAAITLYEDGWMVRV